MLKKNQTICTAKYKAKYKRTMHQNACNIMYFKTLLPCMHAHVCIMLWLGYPVQHQRVKAFKCCCLCCFWQLPYILNNEKLHFICVSFNISIIKLNFKKVLTILCWLNMLIRNQSWWSWLNQLTFNSILERMIFSSSRDASEPVERSCIVRLKVQLTKYEYWHIMMNYEPIHTFN